MKIRFVRQWRNHFANEQADLPEDEARALVSSGYAVPEGGSPAPVPSPPPLSGAGGGDPRVGGGVSAPPAPTPKSVTVRVGENSWVEISLWPPRPGAEEAWKRRAGVTVRKLGRENGAVQVREVLHLTPGTALSVGAVLLQWGVEGKVLDRGVEE